jgi:hypothetical protein
MDAAERNQIIEECAAKCDEIGDAEWKRLMAKGGGVAVLAQRHYIKAAEAIRALKTAE